MDQVQKLTFSEELWKQHYGLVITVIRSELAGCQLDDLHSEYDDLLQKARIWFNYAITKYDSSKHTKFSTFLTTVLKSKFGTLRNQINNKNSKGFTNNFSHFGKDTHAQLESGKFSEDGSHIRIDQQMNYFSTDTLIDIKMRISGMPEVHKKVYIDYFILGKTIDEILKQNLNMKYNQLKIVINDLKISHARFIEELEC